MPDYKKHYASLLFTVDAVLTLMENDDLLQWDNIKKILADALMEIEDQVIDEMEELEALRALEITDDKNP